MRTVVRAKRYGMRAGMRSQAAPQAKSRNMEGKKSDFGVFKLTLNQLHVFRRFAHASSFSCLSGMRPCPVPYTARSTRYNVKFQCLIKSILSMHAEKNVKENIN